MEYINDFDAVAKVISDLNLSPEKKNEIKNAVEVTANKKAHDEVLPNIYARTILWMFCAINVSVIAIVILGFCVDSGFFGNPKSGDRFITSNVLMALITGVTIQVSYAIRTMTNFFFKAQENISGNPPQLPLPQTP